MLLDAEVSTNGAKPTDTEILADVCGIWTGLI